MTEERINAATTEQAEAGFSDDATNAANAAGIQHGAEQGSSAELADKPGKAGKPAKAGKPVKDKDARVNRMGTASIAFLLVEFAIPSIMGMLVNGAYNIIDSVFLGNAMGSLGLSTATVAMPTMTIFMSISMLLGNGGNALCALRLGEGRREAAERSLGNTVLLSLLVAVVVFLFARINPAVDLLLSISGAQPENWELARDFIQIISCGFFLQCIGMGVNNFIRTAGAPNRALLTMAIGAVACTIFNFLFVMLLGWGVQGSALATVCGQGVSCISVLWYFIFTKNVPLKLRLRQMSPEWRTMGMIVSLGMASFIMQVGNAVVNFVTNNLLAIYGAQSVIGAEGALASIGIVMRIAMFVILPVIGVAIAAQPLLGFNYGARNFGRVRKTITTAIIGGIGLGTSLWTLIQLFPVQIVTAFGISDPSLMDFTVFALRIQVLVLPIVAVQVCGSNYFQATGQPLRSILLSMTRQIIFLVPLLLVLPHVIPLFTSFTGLDALYIATPIADLCSISVVTAFLIYERRRLYRLEAEEAENREAEQAAAKEASEGAAA